MRHRWVGFVFLVWVGAILFVATTSGFSETHRAVWGFFHHTLGLDHELADFATNVVRKGFHVPAYALVGALLWWALPPWPRKTLLVLLLAFLLATTDEILQGFQPQRTGRPFDVGVDLLGAYLGILFARRFGGERRRGCRQSYAGHSHPRSDSGVLRNRPDPPA